MVPSWELRIVCAFCDCYTHTHPNQKYRMEWLSTSSRYITTRMTASTRQLLGEGDELLPSYMGIVINHYIFKDPYLKKTILWNVKRGFLTFARLDLEIPAILQPGGTRKLQGESVHLWNLTSPKFKIDTKSDGLETVSQVSTHYKVSPYKRYKWSSYNPYNFPILSRVTTWGYNEPPI